MMPVEIEEMGLSAGINAILTRYSFLDLDFSYEEHFDEDSLSTNLKILLFRIIQEGINNIVKHAEASEVHIQLKEDNKILLLNISDNGKGFDAMNIQYKSLGLKALKSTVRSIDGNLEIDSKPGEGTSLKFKIPLL